MNENDKKLIQTIHKNFYNSVKYNLKKEFYKNEENKIYFKYNK
jgi:hypothetical protein